MEEDIQRKIGSKMILFAWIGLLGLIAFSFSRYLEESGKSQLSISGDTVTLKQNHANHYVTTVLVNGTAVNALLDTGATYISIPGEMAKRLKLKAGSRHRATTANGDVTVYDTRLDSIQIGNIKQRNIRANINPSMRSDTILLGMNFLKNLELIQREDELTLSVPLLDKLPNTHTLQ